MPDLTDDVNDHLALALVPGLGPKLTAALLAAFGSASAARTASAARLRGIPQIGAKLAEAFASALASIDLAPELQLLDQHGVRPVPLGFPGYPPPLAGVVAPPSLLYMRGDWTDTDRNAVGIVGSRGCTGYGKRMTEQITRGLVRAGVTIVSGLARGVDGVAHRTALDAGGRTIAVLAGGLADIYPPEHTDLAREIVEKNAGALITETPMTVAPQPGMFPARNRIISGLSRAVVVVEANIRSGALITAKHALEQGREVFAVPGNVDSPASAGCLDLIRAGARLVRSADDILEDLQGIAAPSGPDTSKKPKATAQTGEADSPRLFERDSEPAPPPPPPSLDPVQQRFWDLLSARKHGDELAREAGVPVGDLSRVLMQLELKRLIRRLPGNFYERR